MTPIVEGVPDLPNRLRRQADNVEGEGWLKAAWLMRHAADEVEEGRAVAAEPAGQSADEIGDAAEPSGVVPGGNISSSSNAKGK